MTTFLTLLIVFLALFGAPIFSCMMALAILGATTLPSNIDQSLYQRFAGELVRVKSLATGDAASQLATIPLFTLAGYVMAEAKTAKRLVGLAQALVGWIPGGLALVTILACALFTTFTGASGVTIVAVGGLILPSLLKEGYKERFSLGLVTGTGSVGLLFPPALPLIVYGIVYGVSSQGLTSAGGDTMELPPFSMERFLFAGIVPGMVLVGLIGLYAIVIAVREKVPRVKFDGAAAARATAAAIPELAIPILILLTLVTGWLQIPEVAAFTALYVLLVEVVWYRDVRVRDLPRVTREAMIMVGAIFTVIVAATALTDYFINARIPDRLYGWMDDYIQSKWTFLFALNILLLVVGCLMDIFSAIVVVVPLIVPAAVQYGIDPYHLGVIFLLNLEIGYLTPPVGLNLFISSLRFKKPMTEVVGASLPFLGVMFLALALVTYVPQLTPIRVEDKKGPGQTDQAGDDLDAGLAREIVHQDGGVWTPERCDALKAEGDELGYVECQNMFRFYARCEKLTEELDKLECKQVTLEGEDWFTDAGPDDEEEDDEDEDEADAGPDDEDEDEDEE